MKRRLMVFGAVELRFSLNNKDLGVNSACVRVSAGFILDYSLLVRRVFSSANYSDRAVWNFELSRPFFLVQGAFGCATLLDKSLPIEEGDARYMPSEILNEKHNNLDKADIFSLGVAMYELIRGSPLPEEGPQTLNLKKGKLPLLPGHSLQLQNLLKAMLDPNPVCRPSAKELVENPMHGPRTTTIAN